MLRRVSTHANGIVRKVQHQQACGVPACKEQVLMMGGYKAALHSQMLPIITSSVCVFAQVRRKLVGEIPPSYSQYTCYTGISDFTPPDIDTVGYRVFLGNRQYFVSSDVGDGKMQW